MKRSMHRVLSSLVQPPVLVAVKPNTSKVNVVCYECADTGTTILSNDFAKPFSPITGGKLEKVTAAESIVMDSHDLSDFVIVAYCEECKVSFLSHEDFANEANGASFHCVTCGGDVTVDVEDKEQEADAGCHTSADEEGEVLVDEPSKTEAAAIVPPVGTDGIQGHDHKQGPSVDKGTESPLHDKSPIGVTSSTESSVPADATGAAPVTLTPAADLTPNLNATTNIAQAPTTAETPKTDSTVEASEVTENSILFVPLKELASLNTAISSFQISTASEGAEKVCYLYHKQQPVAKFTTEKASEGVSTLLASGDNRKLAHAFSSAVAKERGVSPEVIAHFGLEPLSIRVPVSAAIKQNIEAETQKTYELRAQLEEDIMQRIAIAACYINKGLDKQLPNSLRETLVAELAATGVHNSAKVVDRAFASGIENYTKSILVKANELADKPVEVRNELARFAAQANYMPVSGDQDVALDLRHHPAEVTTSSVVTAPQNENNITRLRGLFRGC